MPITEDGFAQTWDADGNLISSIPVTIDVTEQVTREDLETKARNALAANLTFLDTPNGSLTQADALVQLKALTRQVNAMIRLFPGLEDLLVENTDT